VSFSVVSCIVRFVMGNYCVFDGFKFKLAPIRVFRELCDESVGKSYNGGKILPVGLSVLTRDVNSLY
jgi:hypothetical protein